MNKAYGKNDTLIEARVGETFTIELEGNPSTGYQWQEDIDTEKVKLLDRVFEAHTQNIGSAGKVRLTFQPISEGDTTIFLGYRPVWEKDNFESVEFKLRARK
jgi:inhibitor of cysteine peptidase